MLLGSSRAFRGRLRVGLRPKLLRRRAAQWAALLARLAELPAARRKWSVLLCGWRESYVPSITSTRRSGSEGMMIQRMT